jgi:hypothetical protein
MLVTKHQKVNSNNLNCYDTFIRPTELLKTQAYSFCTPEDIHGNKYSRHQIFIGQK